MWDAKKADSMAALKVEKKAGRKGDYSVGSTVGNWAENWAVLMAA